MNDTLKMIGTYNFEIRDVNGKIRDAWKVKNLVVSAGKAQMASLAGDATATPFTYVALGTTNTAPAAGNTALAAEITDSGFQRAAGTVTRITTTVTNDTLSISKTFTASGSKTLEEVGIFNASSSGTMLSRALTGTKAMSSGEQITITYTLAFV